MATEAFAPFGPTLAHRPSPLRVTPPPNSTTVHDMGGFDRFWDLWGLPVLPYSLAEFLPRLAVTMVLALLVGRVAAAPMGLSPRRAIVWMLCMLAPLAYTLSPSGFDGGSGCTLGLTPWQFPAAIFALDSRANVIMLIPVGAAAFLFKEGARRLAALLTALSLPLVIELVQLAAPSLGRSCQFFDVVYNITGVFAGFWLVAGTVALRDAVRDSRP